MDLVEKPDGGPAFACVQTGTATGHENRDGKTCFELAFNTANGMTLRDYFAGQALVGLLASEANARMAEARRAAARALDNQYTQQLTAEAYDIADEMLEARKQ